MNHEDILKKLEKIVKQQLARVKKSYTGVSQLGLIELARAQDYFFVGASYDLPGQGDLTNQYRNQFRLYAEGWFEALRLFLKDSGSNATFILPSNESSTAWALAALGQLGYLGLLKRFVDLAYFEVYDCEFDGKNTYTFTSKVTDVGIEYLEALNQKWLAQYQLNQSDHDYINTWEAVAANQLKEQVKLHNHSFIKYESTSLLDKFYLAKGTRYIEPRIGYDYYPGHVKFGGIIFSDWLLVMACLVGRSLMHRDFCFAAQEKTSLTGLNPWNLYPLVTRLEDFSAYIVEQTAISKLVVDKILETVVLTEKRLTCIYFPSGYAPPVLVRLNKSEVLLTLIGNQANPLVYLNRCLRYDYEQDYSSAVNEREHQFREDLYQWFDPKILKIVHNVNLKTKVKLYTDLDAVLFDKKNNILIIIQLKFMEDWATDMKQRESMVVNFHESVTKWVKGIDDFINDNGEAELLKKLSRKAIKPGCTIYKLVIGKHFSQFSNGVLASGYIYANWATVVKTMVQNPQCSSSLKLFLTGLSETDVKNDLAELHRDMNRFDFKVGRSVITVKH